MSAAQRARIARRANVRYAIVSAPKSSREWVIEATVTRWAIAVLGGLAITAATCWPWYSAQATDGSAVMAGGGAWTTTGDLDAGLRPLPLAVLVYLSAGVLVYSAVRSAFGVAVAAAMATFAAAVLPFLVVRAVDRHVPGSAAVGIDVATAPRLLLAIGFVATVVCWIGYARCVLRAAPRVTT